MPLLSLTDKAWRRGIVRTDPFGEYSLEMQETDRGYLTEEELRTLANAVFVKKQTSLVRDMFLFGCFTGLSYIDIKTLTHDKIQRMDFDGEEWIITRRTKTRVSSNVPLMEIAKELIEKYRGLAGGDLVFPMPSNSVCNTHLKHPYANAFNDGPLGSYWETDHTQHMVKELHERKWEIDSLCYPIRLAYHYWQYTEDTSVFDENWHKAMLLVVKP